MMKKRGFTLAEVLVTLGIVGIIFALTAPALVESSNNKIYASKLAVSVSTLENALGGAMSSEGVTELSRVSFWSAASNSDFVSGLGRYLTHRGSSNYNTANVKYLSNLSLAADSRELNAINRGARIMLKSGAVVFIDRDYTIDNRANPNRITVDAAVIIDVNGNDKPNIFGRDIFEFLLGDNGVLYPFGGSDVGVLFQNSSTELKWNESQAGESYVCTDASIADGDSEGTGCTARVIEENYKMNY